MHFAYASGTIWRVLSWVVAIPVFVGLVVMVVEQLFEQDQSDVPRRFAAWLLICVVLFWLFHEPLVQLAILTDDGLQSLRAPLSSRQPHVHAPSSGSMNDGSSHN